jgi:hypothetical protein
MLRCGKTAARPRLDGRLDDPVWQTAQPAVLTSTLGDDGQWPAAVMFARDSEYLYIAVNCRQAPGVNYEGSAAGRTRDADLGSHDRVDIFLDLDRDYATYYHLTIDHRGWAADECFGDSSWNPTWYVAARTADGAWTAEAAIPWRELIGRAKLTAAEGVSQAGNPLPSVWAIGIQRTVPGVGFQSWSTPASTTVRPEGFGYIEVKE